jgi:hypothetical protein
MLGFIDKRSQKRKENHSLVHISPASRYYFQGIEIFHEGGALGEEGRVEFTRKKK